MSGTMAKRLREPIQTDQQGRFAIRIGPGGVYLGVIPVNVAEEVGLELVARTTFDDLAYPDTPLY
jgi:hypothetical protein